MDWVHFLLTFWHLPVVVLAGWLLAIGWLRRLPGWYPVVALAVCFGVALLGYVLVGTGGRILDGQTSWQSGLGFMLGMNGVAGLTTCILPALVTPVVHVLSAPPEGPRKVS